MAAQTVAKPPRKAAKPAAARLAPASLPRRAAIARSGTSQAVRLPQDYRFPDGVKEVRIRRQGDSLLLSPMRSDWMSFFCLDLDVPEGLLERRGDPPQVRDPL